jgi:hypothetical protein
MRPTPAAPNLGIKRRMASIGIIASSARAIASAGICAISAKGRRKLG